MPALVILSFFCVGPSSVLGKLGILALYHRWRGGCAGGLLRLGAGLAGTCSMALFLAYLVLNEEWGWVWWAVFVLALTTVVLVAGYLYGPNDRPDPEGGASEERGPSN